MSYLLQFGWWHPGVGAFFWQHLGGSDLLQKVHLNNCRGNFHPWEFLWEKDKSFLQTTDHRWRLGEDLWILVWGNKWMKQWNELTYLYGQWKQRKVGFVENQNLSRCLLKESTQFQQNDKMWKKKLLPEAECWFSSKTMSAFEKTGSLSLNLQCSFLHLITFMDGNFITEQSWYLLFRLFLEVNEEANHETSYLSSVTTNFLWQTGQIIFSIESFSSMAESVDTDADSDRKRS